MGFIDTIKAGLAKTRAALSETLEEDFSASEIDEDFYDELEETLIMADLGRETALKVIMKLRHTVNNTGIKKVQKAREAMQEILAVMLRVGDMAQAVVALQEKGLIAYACVVDAAATPITAAGMGQGSVALIGNEGNGLRTETVAACKHSVTIPMAGRAESLNASMAAGIILWEMCRGK